MKTTIAKLLLSASFLLFGFSLMAQVPPHPPGHNQTTNQAPAGPSAPIGSGMALLIGLSAVYGAKKVQSARKEDEN
jgi:hypothetical protein